MSQNKSKSYSRFRRANRGNMLIFISAVTLGLVLALAFFALNFARLLGSNQEQTTCIQSAALAAANDLSKIVISDPKFGFVAISDCAPLDPQDNANDGYYAPVLSINTLLATVRLDMIISQSIGQPIMQQLAQDDYNNAMTAKNSLVTALQTAVVTGGVDMNGNAVNPLTDAVTAYNQNSIRMTGNGTQLVAGSMKLSLGCIPNLPTDTPVPTPAASASASGSQICSVNGKSCYSAFINVPFNGNDFVFAGTTNAIKLCDPRQFQTTIAGAPYVIPTIVKAEADQTYQPAAHNGQTGAQIVHAAACAEPMNLIDPRPCPGSFCVSFPDKVPKNVHTIKDILAMPAQLTAFFASGGDFPPGSAQYPGAAPNTGSLSTGAARHVGATGSVGAFTQLGLYDWLRRNGTRPDIQAVTDMLAFSFVPVPGPTGEKYIFSIDPAGTGAIQFYGNYCNPTPFLSVGNTQLIAQPAWDNPTALAALGNALWPSNPGSWSDGGDSYDIYIRDEVYTPNATDLFHVGEPMYDNLLFQATSGKFNTQLITSRPDSDGFWVANNGEHGAGGMGANGGGGGGGGGSSKCDTTIAGPVGTIWTRDDFGFDFVAAGGATAATYEIYPTYPNASPPAPANPHSRPTYNQNGLCCDVRFRWNLPPAGAPGGSLGHCIH